jgi:hypothetical protein
MAWLYRGQDPKQTRPGSSFRIGYEIEVSVARQLRSPYPDYTFPQDPSTRFCLRHTGRLRVSLAPLGGTIQVPESKSEILFVITFSTSRSKAPCGSKVNPRILKEPAKLH